MARCVCYLLFIVAFSSHNIHVSRINSTLLNKKILWSVVTAVISTQIKIYNNLTFDKLLLDIKFILC